MEERRRTRSQGPPSLPENNELIQWDSIPDPVRIEREHAEACRLVRQADTATNTSKNTVESSKIPQEMTEPYQGFKHMPKSGEILPKEKEAEGQVPNMLKSGEISPNQQEKANPRPGTPNLGEIPQRESQQVIDLVAMEEGGTVELNEGNAQQGSPQVDTAEHYLDDHFSDVMRSSALGSNVSSLFNTTAFNTTHNEYRVTLNWVLPDSKNSHLETLKDKNIVDFPALGGKTGAMLVYLPDLEPFYDTSKFLIDLQSGELFVKLQNKWHLAGLTCRKKDFEVDQLMALIQHASIRLKNNIYKRKEDTDVLVLDPTKAQAPLLPFIPDTGNYITHDKPMLPTMRKNYIKDRAQAVVTYFKEYGNTRLWTLDNLVPKYKLTQRLQIVFGRTDAVREVIDKAIECDDEMRRKKCMHYLRPPKRFPTPENMDSEETAMWIGWIHKETHALLEDLNKEIRLQNETDNPFTKNIVYATENHHTSEIPPDEHIQQHEEKFASPLSMKKTNIPLPQWVDSHSKILPIK